jgi:outer membrane cobalamin receptor
VTASDDARAVLDAAVQSMSGARRMDEEDPPGVVTAWVLVTAERFADEGGEWGSTVRIVPADDLPDWQSLGLLEAGKALLADSWRTDG